ncbi:hypothetical protein [Mycoplasma sp. 2634B]|uniref:hypothetical protein n=1 Tax=Mycoplasma sp. 2634B TaxID=3401692 RepID=UPI003AAC88E9
MKSRKFGIVTLVLSSLCVIANLAIVLVAIFSYNHIKNTAIMTNPGDTHLVIHKYLLKQKLHPYLSI